MNVTYRDLTEENVQRCLDLWTARMAAGYEDRVLLANASGDVDGYVGTVAETDDGVVGFAAGHVGTFAGILAVPYTRAERRCSLDPVRTVGYADVLCVERTHEGRGIGTELARRTVSALAAFGHPVVTQVWRRDDTDGGDVVAKLGFEPVLTLDDYWGYTTRGHGPCPECGQSPCACPGTLFVRPVADATDRGDTDGG